MTKDQEIGIWKGDGASIYVLHEREDGMICNKFSFTIYPDWSSEGAKNGVEDIASRIVSVLNQEDLKTIKLAITREIENVENNPNLDNGIGYPIGKIKAYSDVLKMINEHII